MATLDLGVGPIDRSQFNEVGECSGIVVNVKEVEKVRKQIGPLIRKVKNEASVRTLDAVADWNSCPAEVRNDDHRVLLITDEQAVKGLVPNAPVVRVMIQKTYKDFSAKEVFKRLLPEAVTVPSAFEVIGHIAHLNLADNQLPFKNVLGQVILDKNPALRTVVHKVSNVESKFRVCPVEVLAGDSDLTALITEGGYRFKVDFGKVFWNSRLCGERARLTELIPPGSIVCDVMGGVGAFGVYLAAKGCRIFANDLNEEAAKLMRENVRLNSKKIPRLECMYDVFNLDGKAFIKLMICGDESIPSVLPGAAPRIAEVGERSAKRRKFGEGDSCQEVQTNEAAVFFIMNLPGEAVNFLDVFPQVMQEHCSNLRGPSEDRVNVICYAFANSTTGPEELIEKISHVLLSFSDGYKIVHLRRVRNVSPTKNMFACHLVFDARKK